MQAPGKQHRAKAIEHLSDHMAAQLSLDIASAYPEHAGVDSWVRTLRLDRLKNQVGVRDEYRLSKPVGEITLTLMTAREPKAGAHGILNIELAQVHYDARIFAPKVEEIRIEDAKLRSGWGEKIWRVLLVCTNPQSQGRWQLLLTEVA
jgi:hypothetical protein